MKPRNEVLPCVVQETVKYDPHSGKLYWKQRDLKYFKSEAHQKTWNKRYAGKEAFCGKHPSGYLFGALFGKNYYAHRIAFCAYYGFWPEYIDHVNHKRTDNRIENLRSVSFAENRRNQSPMKGKNFTGITWRKDCPLKPWYVRIGRDNSVVGNFTCLGQAIRARKNAEKMRGYHHNHGNTPRWMCQP